MSKHNYENKDIAKVINESFVPVRVDTDRRPDINERYNQGGWPTTVFLDEKGNIITGATYVPPHEFGFMLEQVKNFYSKNAGKIPEMTERGREHSETELSKVPDIVARSIEESFDIDYGGFSYGQKFPMSDVLEFCMARYALKRDKMFRLFVTATLDNMQGIMDRIEGGFFRYATDRQWSVPHYEKMLEGNAEIIASYAHAYAMTGRTEYAKIAEKAIEYVMKNLMGEAFYGSQDADEKYYMLDGEERKGAEKPRVDRTIFVNLNAKMISAFMEASIYLEKDYIKTALGVLNFILEKCHSNEKGFCHYLDVECREYGMLADNAQMLKALLNAYELTRNERYMKIAKDVAEFIRNNFFSGGSLNDRIHGDDIGMLAMRNRNIAENSAVADSFIRLAFHTDDDSFREKAEIILKDLGDIYGMYGIMAAPYASAIERILNGVQIKLQCSDAEHEETLKIFNPLKMIKFMGNGEFTAVICKGSACLQAKSMEELRNLL